MQPRVPTFTTAGLLDYIVELAVCEDEASIPLIHITIIDMALQAFQLVDRGPFRRLLMYLRPSLTDKDIPHRNMLRKEILNRSKLVEARVKEELMVCLICVRSGGW